MKERKLKGRYQEGAKGHCYECGRPKEEHRKGKCPQLRERNDGAAHRPKHHLSRDHFGIGIVR